MLFDMQVQQLAVEQQLAGSDFAVTNSRPHKTKQARLEKMSSVWDWLRDSSDGQANAEQQQQGHAMSDPHSNLQPAQESAKQQQHQHQQQQPAREQLGSSKPGGHGSTQQADDAGGQGGANQQQQQPQPSQEQILHAAA